ncbi:pteroicidin-alpha-like [Sebastes fasciatus]|uniref:pteroicidin-alpha-like n=1 Tax=Sebastes fasciatus TaxID=394691 RepID=UPI003D9E33FE
MKCIALFLVLSMVVLMAEPGEAFWVRHFVKSLFGDRKMDDQQEQLDKRSVDYTGQPGDAGTP